MKSRTVAVAVLVAAVALGLSAPPTAGFIAFGLAALAVVLGPRLEADRLVQAIMSVAAMVGGVLIARATALPPDEVQAGASERAILFGMPMLGVAAARAVIRNPVYGDRVTLTAALVALTAAGRAKIGITFGILAAVFLLLAVLALRFADKNRAPLKALSKRHYLTTLGGFAIAASLALFARWSLPQAHDALISRLMARFAANRSGFSDNMTLGSMSGMLMSDAVVMRVRGNAPPLLRGVALTRYSRGQWQSSMSALSLEVVETADHVAEDFDGVEIENARSPKRYFLPLGAESVTTSTGFYARDAYGIARPSGDIIAKRVWFEPGEAPTTEPKIEDLEVPQRIAPALRGILAEWGVLDTLPPAEKLKIIENRLLDDYTYSLESDRDPKKDPVIDFLTVHKLGHCEYFASAFTLLARAARVPARVIAGYRAVERSPLGYTIVRDRHAHSWSEAYVDGVWRTYDPTPAGETGVGGESETGWFGALTDGIRTGWEIVDDWLGQRTAFEFTLSLVVAISTLLMVRSLRAQSKKRAKLALDPHPIELEQLVKALAKKGIARTESETLERLAARVRNAETLGGDVKEQAATALEQYEALRYGRSGEPKTVLASMTKVAARVQARA